MESSDNTPPKFALEMHDVCKSFGSKKVLRNLNLQIAAKESFVIIGGSGSGKSVILKCLLGLMRPEKGEIFIDGENVTRLPTRKRDEYMKKFGMLFQGAALFDSLKVWENVAFGLMEGKRMPRKAARDVAMQKLATVGLSADVGELYPSSLSGGMQKRVSLARAIAGDPEIILFDEPTTGLDPIMTDVINKLIRKCVQELGATAISITHDMHSARAIADKIAMLYQGEIIWSGTVPEMEATDNPYVQQFVQGLEDGPISVDVGGGDKKAA